MKNIHYVYIADALGFQYVPAAQVEQIPLPEHDVQLGMHDSHYRISFKKYALGHYVQSDVVVLNTRQSV